MEVYSLGADLTTEEVTVQLSHEVRLRGDQYEKVVYLRYILGRYKDCCFLEYFALKNKNYILSQDFSRTKSFSSCIKIIFH